MLESECCNPEIRAALHASRRGEDVKELSFFRRGVDDSCLANLAALKTLEYLELYGTGTADAGLAHLAPLTKLRRLDLCNNRDVTDAGLTHLAGLVSLEVLNLRGTGITDSGLTALAGLTAIRELHLFGTRISEGSLGQLKGLNRLEDLDLSSRLTTDEGLQNLVRSLRLFPSLKVVSLAGPYWQEGDDHWPRDLEAEARLEWLRREFPQCRFGVRLL